MSMEWRSLYSVNIKELDEQHKKIFKIINKFFETGKDTNEKMFKEIIKDLKDYSALHFRTEEKYFKKYEYSESEPHIKMHKAYDNKIIELERNEFSKKNILELSNFLKDWWIKHIQNMDQKYSEYLNDKGLY